MSENREEILANFQSIAAIDDLAEAIHILDDCDWDLLAAVSRVMPIDDAGYNNLNRVPDIDIIENTAAPNFENIASSDVEGASSSKPWQPRKLIRFNVHYMNTPTEIDVPDTITVGQLKNQLAPKLGVPTCRMILKNWPDRLNPSNDVVLSTLNLPKENILILTDMQDFASPDSESAARLMQSYTLEIRNLDTDLSYSLNFPGTKTILEVKTDVYTLTDIPARHQSWTGWPRSCNDSIMLAMAGLDYPNHSLTVKKCVPAPSTSNRNNRQAESSSSTSQQQTHGGDNNSSSSAEEEFEDASDSAFNVEDDAFVDQMRARRAEPLIPDQVDDETIGCLHFSERYGQRYGPRQPAFFAGSLEDAVREACQKPAKERKLLAIYLHHDASVLSNVFCTQLLGFDTVLETLARHFVVYGWDFTFESNRNLFLSSLSSCLNTQAAMQVRSIHADRLPALVLVMRTRSVTELYTIVHGNVGVDELLTSIMEAVEVFAEGVRAETREEEERAAREKVKWEQDEAYRESLEADRAKERARLQQERAAAQERERIESERKRQADQREERRKRVLDTMPPEPPQDGAGDGVTKIRIRLPTGDFAERRFLITTALKVLLDYMIVLGYPSEEFKVISSWPRRDLTTMDPVSTLQELKLYPQETVIVEER